MTISETACNIYNKFCVVWIGYPSAIHIHVPMFFLVLCLNFLFFTGYNTSTMFIMLIVAPILLILLNVFLCFTFKNWSGIAFFVGCIIICIGIGVSAMYYYAAHDKMSTKIEDIPVERASEYPDAGVFYFTNGIVLAQETFLGEYKQTKSPSEMWKRNRYYCVVPIVPSTKWNSTTDYVSLFAGCFTHDVPCEKALRGTGGYSCIKRWKRDERSGVTVESEQVKRFQAAVEDARKKYDLKLKFNSPTIYWSDPDEIFDSWLEKYRVAITVPNVLWILITLACVPYYLKQRASLKHKKISDSQQSSATTTLYGAL